MKNKTKFCKSILYLSFISLFGCVPPLNYQSYMQENMGGNTSVEWQPGEIKENINGEITVWCPSEDRSVTNEIVRRFKIEYPNVTVKVSEVAENKSKDQFLKDPAKAADVFAIVDNDIPTLAEAEYLFKIPNVEVPLGKKTINFSDKIKSESLPWTITPMSYPFDGVNLYGFPQTADNGYLLMYNKSLINENQVASLETILEVAKTNNKQFMYDYKNGFYLPGAFLANGGHLQVEFKNNRFVQVCDFNDNNGVQAAERMKAIVNEYGSALYASSDNGEIQTKFKDNSALGVITGTWNVENVERAIGSSNVGFARLPTININETPKTMGAFRGVKALVVKSSTTYPLAALAYSSFATNYDSQYLRFIARQAGPSNIELTELKEVTDNKMLQALTLSQQAETSVSQALATTPLFWDAMGALGTTIGNGNATWGVFPNSKAILDAIVAQMTTN
ncbi:MAG: extracellular solute-binding protein [Bacillales bacterium]|nr:extracellular solute-binding protein [Bacillales bacterium]